MSSLSLQSFLRRKLQIKSDKRTRVKLSTVNVKAMKVFRLSLTRTNDDRAQNIKCGPFQSMSRVNNSPFPTQSYHLTCIYLKIYLYENATPSPQIFSCNLKPSPFKTREALELVHLQSAVRDVILQFFGCAYCISS